ncbi:hypothetical protein TNCV_4459361 [Trichonephila clavipes]|nr:hypothetical protein TNCV_4459361 [Trichonephila clavipes]
MADKDILGFVHSPKNIIGADSDEEHDMNNATSVPASSEMRNAMKSMRSYLDAHSNGEMNNKMDDIEQLVDNLIQKETTYNMVRYNMETSAIGFVGCIGWEREQHLQSKKILCGRFEVSGILTSVRSSPDFNLNMYVRVMSSCPHISHQSVSRSSCRDVKETSQKKKIFKDGLLQ